MKPVLRIIEGRIKNMNTKEDILKNMGNQTLDGSHWFP